MASGRTPCANLVTALLALEHGLIDQARLLAAFRSWRSSPGRPMTEILLAEGSLDRSAYVRLEQLAAAGGDPGDADPELSLTVAYRSSAGEVAGSRAPHAASQDSRDPAGPPPRYRVLRSHARGGLGEVFVALDAELNREVALKEILPYHAHDPDSQARFVLEAEITGRLEHPGIVPVYGLGRYRRRPAVLRDAVHPRARRLKEAIERFHAAERVEARSRASVSWSSGGCCGGSSTSATPIAYAHSRGVLHRDIKPEQHHARPVRRDAGRRLGPRQGAGAGSAAELDDRHAACPVGRRDSLADPPGSARGDAART